VLRTASRSRRPPVHVRSRRATSTRDSPALPTSGWARGRGRGRA
jgi:hypothetical protein